MRAGLLLTRGLSLPWSWAEGRLFANTAPKSPRLAAIKSFAWIDFRLVAQTIGSCAAASGLLFISDNKEPLASSGAPKQCARGKQSPVAAAPSKTRCTLGDAWPTGAPTFWRGAGRGQRTRSTARAKVGTLINRRRAQCLPACTRRRHIGVGNNDVLNFHEMATFCLLPLILLSPTLTLTAPPARIDLFNCF